MTTPVNEGDILAGKYRVEQVLGIGGMGVVVAAHHLQLDEKVAIKFLLPEALEVPDAVARFTREGRAAVRIKSEHVARVSDVGTLESGAPYMVMEYLEGLDLSGWLKERGALPVELAVEFVLQACEAIAEAHALGIVHRDLKPANLFCVRRADDIQSIKVLDFGISKTTAMGGADCDHGLTKTKAVMGSPLYMSPEQMQSSKHVDSSTDIWALGVILYELVTGEVPFDGESLPALVLNIASAEPRPLRDLRPDAPLGLEAVILRCLEKKSAQRYANIGELATALAEFGPERARASADRITRVIRAAGLSTGGSLLPAEPAAPAPLAASAPGSQTQQSWGKTASGGRGTRRALAGVGALTLLGGIAAALLFTSQSPSAEPGSSAAASTLQAPADLAAAPASASAATTLATGSLNDAPPAPTEPASAAASTSASAPHSVAAPEKSTLVKAPAAPRPTASAAPPAAPATGSKYNPLDHL